jgi:hypothetical protein
MYELSDNTQFKVFKVKYRAEANYYKFTNSTSDDDRYNEFKKDSWYTNNWPYDYFSLIHLVNIQAGEAYKPDVVTT